MRSASFATPSITGSNWPATSREFLGDVMFVRADGSAYHSSVGRGGGRATVLEMHASLTPPAVRRQIA
jgi:hypothetical protein